MDELAQLYVFALSIGVGLLIGLEREHKRKTKAGLRTCALASLSGTVLALLAEHADSPWILAAGFLVLGLMMIAADRRGSKADDDPETTTTLALLLCYAYGALLWFGYTQIAITLAMATAVLLYFKAELHEVTHRLSREELLSFFQFAVIAFVVLPLLPDRGYGPHEALNPYKIWLIVVLISGVSLAGYAALRLIGPGRAAPVLGVLGGLVSSTATTLVFARHTRADARHAPVAAVVILTANLCVLLRLAVICALVAPRLLPELGLMLGLGFACGLPFCLPRGETQAEAPPLEIKNPTELPAALSFAALFALVLLATAWINDRLGAGGVYGIAALSGLTDVDAITLSALRMSNSQELSGTQAATAILLAYAANLVFKYGVVLSADRDLLARRAALGYASALAGLVVGRLLMTLTT